MASTGRQEKLTQAQSKMACLSLFSQERRLKPDLRLSFEIQCPMQMNHPTVEAVLFSFLDRFLSHVSCPGQHKSKVICWIRSLGGDWSHQADVT